MRRMWLALLLASVGLAGRGLAQQDAKPPSDALVRKRIHAAEADLQGALVAEDRKALDTLYADDFEWRHWTGERDTKESWLRFLRDSVTYEQHLARPQRITIYTRAVWVSGLLTVRGRYRGESNDFAYRLQYGRLWVEDNGRWRVREQVTRGYAEKP